MEEDQNYLKINMYIAMNRFKIVLGKENEFENVWKNRDTHLDGVKGFKNFNLIKGETNNEYSSPTFVSLPADNPCRESHGISDREFCVVVPIVRKKQGRRRLSNGRKLSGGPSSDDFYTNDEGEVEVTSGYKSFECPTGATRAPIQLSLIHI